MAFTLRKIDLHLPTALWYSEYLKSERWKAFRLRIIEERGTACEVCFERPHFSLHHNTYARLFNEREADVTLVCKECHQEIHTKYEIPFIGLIYHDDEKQVRVFINDLKNNKAQPKQREAQRTKQTHGI